MSIVIENLDIPMFVYIHNIYYIYIYYLYFENVYLFLDINSIHGIRIGTCLPSADSKL